MVPREEALDKLSRGPGDLTRARPARHGSLPLLGSSLGCATVAESVQAAALVAGKDAGAAKMCLVMDSQGAFFSLLTCQCPRTTGIFLSVRTGATDEVTSLAGEQTRPHGACERAAAILSGCQLSAGTSVRTKWTAREPSTAAAIGAPRASCSSRSRPSG